MNKRLSYWTKIVFFAFIGILSAYTSFRFFVTVFYLGGDESPLGSFFTGLVGVLVLDGAFFAWLRIFLSASDNNDERAFAVIGALVGLIGSIVASFAYLLSTTSTIDFPPTLQAWSTLALAVIVVVHFVLVAASSFRSTQAQIDERMSSLRSDATEQMLLATSEEFRAMMPQLARQNAQQLAEVLSAEFSLLPSGDSKK